MLRTLSRLITQPRGAALTAGSHCFHNHFGRGKRATTSLPRPPPAVEIDYEVLNRLTPEALLLLREAFVGPKAYGVVAVTNIPGYGDKLGEAFQAGINLALADPAGRERASAVNNTYPGWSGTPGQETHPLQSSFLFNVKEEVPGGKPDPYFGKNIFPSEEFRGTFVKLATPMHEVALTVLRGCDLVMEELASEQQHQWTASGRSLHELALKGPALAGRFICYDSGFTREDNLLGQSAEQTASSQLPSTAVKSAQHAGDGLASMRTHSTPVKSAGHAGDGLASMRTHSTPVKSAGHAGDGLASMRTHSTPVRSAGHAGDGLASMRTHSTPVKSAGHAGDGLASMRTHSTPVKSAGHAGDGLASMRTHSTPVKSAGHAVDGLASMRTHSTPIRSAGHAIESSVQRHSTPQCAGSVREHSTQTVPGSQGGAAIFPMLEQQASAGAEPRTAGDYWLPWHIDSNFVTVLHRERYASERDSSPVPEPEGAGLVLMNEVGDVAKVETSKDSLLLQMGAFAQLYSGGYMTACRHAVLSPQPPGTARFNYCNFWYVPWNTVCEALPGREKEAVNTGWNAMMDSSYLNITMKQSFAAFRQFMTSPEARLQFADSVRFKELSELLPLPAVNPGTSKIVVDILTDIRCPFSFISQTGLELALERLGLNERAVLRYHPVFLNPNVSKEGESLDDYLLREYGYSKEYAHSENYPLRLAGLEVGVLLNPKRRVVNTFGAFCLTELAEKKGKQRETVKALSRRYFEQAEDISDVGVLRAVAEEVGLGEDALAEFAFVGGSVLAKYTELAPRIGEVPHFVIRESVSGNGLEVGGNRSIDEWAQVLEDVMEKSRLVGMSVVGPDGSEVWLAEANPNAPVSLSLPAQHSWVPSEWPYGPHCFSRMDESPDTSMYLQPRLVSHLDTSSLARLKEVYRSFFAVARPGFSVLDLCSSWISHYPEELNAHVVVHGLNRQELDANTQAAERHVQDLNADAKLPWSDGSFDFVTLALSVQYLTDPRAVFAEMHRVLRPGGVALVAHSHRCFIEKAVRIWAEEPHDGEGHAHLICRYFQHGPEGGWVNLSSVDVSPRNGDPLWVVSAVRALV